MPRPGARRLYHATLERQLRARAYVGATAFDARAHGEGAGHAGS
jgi:hypothetical protein